MARRTKTNSGTKVALAQRKGRVLSHNKKMNSVRNSSSLHHRAGRWLEAPKQEHLIVLRALEIANRAFSRVVTAGELAIALTPSEMALIDAKYSNSRSQVISKILALLRARGLVFSPGEISRRRYYGVAGVIDPNTAALPSEESRRGRVLELLRRTVIKNGRPVRVSDVLELARELSIAEDITQAKITHDILSLKETGEILVVASIRGDGKGINLYLPADFNINDYPIPTSQPLTWLEGVSQTINEMWMDRMNEASNTRARPKPLSTGEIRARLNVTSRYPENLSDPIVLVSALQQLAASSNPTIRKIKRRGQKTLWWVPVSVSDENLDLGDTYLNDTERVCEAVCRASIVFGRPVKLTEVASQIDLDPSLRPAGSLNLRSLLSEVSKLTISGGNGPRRKRVRRRVYRIGKIAGDAYYFNEQTSGAIAYVELGALELKWIRIAADEQLSLLDSISLPSVAFGRAMLIAAEANKLITELGHICDGKSLGAALQRFADELGEQIASIIKKTHDWMENRAAFTLRVPEKISTIIPGLTAHELLEIIKPFYPKAQDINVPSKLIPLLDGDIRRVINSDYKSRFTGDPRSSAEYLYDRTDAFIFIAKQWGGLECALQAGIAANELGHLRDHQFILPSLMSQDFNSRLAAVACLAFLPSDEGNEHLYDLAVNDPDPGVRQSALWAYGFAGGTMCGELLARQKEQDPDRRVREFSVSVSEVLAEVGSWWNV